MINKDTKILFFDIDGTLITEDGTRHFPESAKKALAMARENGHLVFINTGRVYCNVTKAIMEAGNFDGYVCGCGTHIVYKGETLFHNDLSRELCDEVVEKCKEYEMKGLYEHSNLVSIDSANADHPLLQEIMSYFGKNGVNICTNPASEEFIFDKFCAWFDEENPYLDEFKNYVNQNFDYIDRGATFCEIVPKGFSKATGIQFLLDYLGLNISNAYAFGDGYNDEPMLEYVPNSIIMEKGPEDLKQKVMMVTENAEDDGIYNAMKRLGII